MLHYYSLISLTDITRHVHRLYIKMEDTSCPEMKLNYPRCKNRHLAHLEPESVQQWSGGGMESVSAVNHDVPVPHFIASNK